MFVLGFLFLFFFFFNMLTRRSVPVFSFHSRVFFLPMLRQMARRVPELRNVKIECL